MTSGGVQRSTTFEWPPPGMSVRRRRAEVTSPARAGRKSGRGRVRLERLDGKVALECAGTEARAGFPRIRALGAVKQGPDSLVILDVPPGRETDVGERIHRLRGEGVIKRIAPVLRDSESRLEQVPTDTLTVRFRARHPSAKVVEDLARRYGLAREEENEFVTNQFVFRLNNDPGGLGILEVASQLNASDEVEFAAANMISMFRRS